MNPLNPPPIAAVYSPTAGIVWTGASLEAAQTFARAQNRACAAQGGYGDRTAYAVDEDGYLQDDRGRHVWPASGQSAGAVHV
jgi:hypothetical protein